MLLRLLHAVESDRRYSWLELGCSMASERGDALSDLDVGLGVVSEAWPQIEHDLPAFMESFGEVVDALYHNLPEVRDLTHLRASVQYANGIQVDLVALPAHVSSGRPSEKVVFYQSDALRHEFLDASPRPFDSVSVREWAFLGWIALANTAKYLRRRSLWESLESLHTARTQIWRLWAFSNRLPDPKFGVTTVLDHEDASVPPGIEATVGVLELVDLKRAALACANLLDETARAAAEVAPIPLPDAFALMVREWIATALEE
jgi:hypothetical protein